LWEGGKANGRAAGAARPDAPSLPREVFMRKRSWRRKHAYKSTATPITQPNGRDKSSAIYRWLLGTLQALPPLLNRAIVVVTLAGSLAVAIRQFLSIIWP